MGLWDRLRNILPRGDHREVRRLQEDVHVLQSQYQSVYDKINDPVGGLREQRRRLLVQLDQARSEDEARVIADRLAQIDREEGQLRDQWDQIERDKTRVQSAINTAKTTATGTQARALERVFQRARQLEDQRARVEIALVGVRERGERERGAAESAIQDARSRVGNAAPLATSPYVEQWRHSRRQAGREDGRQGPPEKA